MGFLSSIFGGGNVEIIAKSIAMHHRQRGDFNAVLAIYYVDFKSRTQTNHKAQQAVKMIEANDITNYQFLSLLALFVDAAPKTAQFFEVIEDFSDDVVKYLNKTGLDTEHISGNVLRL